ncbi:MAG TPA: galactokinase [Candidatus Odoribacter faecigallinarum]|uniref:Galactokinase n=1 Tax=Candidatus Odoribacter faecigallinarum TaxID=2838706 RepID=A0A9D2AC22_9BACT|nr:galactokinase [Candidatus Odoribacter faecigallinarum]
MDLQALENQFKTLFGKTPEYAYFAPGRVNLIGDHTDYNGGLVFPCALSFGTYLLAAQRDDRHNAFRSLNFEYAGTTDATAFSNKPKEWIAYPLGVMKEFADLGHPVWGYDLLYYGNIPNGAGLSSSASIEMVTATMLNDLTGAGLTKVELAQLSQKAENQFVGMNCGIMDQFAVGMGKKDCAIALDCATLHYEYVPLVLDGYKLIIANTNKRRGLADSKYNERRSECEEAIKYISTQHNITHLCQLTEEEFEACASLIPDETIRRRARHAISENQRVIRAITALKAGDLTTFGQLMNDSHRSLKEDYEVTGIELDTLAGESQQFPGVLGSRMTGAGFGGCTVSLVQNGQAEAYIREVGKNYQAKTGLEATFYIAQIGEGAYKLY